MCILKSVVIKNARSFEFFLFLSPISIVYFFKNIIFCIKTTKKWRVLDRLFPFIYDNDELLNIMLSFFKLEKSLFEDLNLNFLLKTSLLLIILI